MKRQLWLSLLLALVVAVVGTGGLAIAQDKTLFWDRYDVNLNVQSNSDILVEEIQRIEFTSGTFRFGFAAIPLDRLERITDVSVAEIIDGVERPYTPSSSNPYGFTTFVNANNELEINWYFPPTSHSQHTYVLRYRVIGGLRFYEAGDQLWWKAIPPDHNFPIRSARVVVRLPQPVPQDQLLIDSYGAPASHTYSPNGGVVFEANSIPAGKEVEVRVQFPPGIVQGSPSEWQRAFDLRQTWGPVVGVIFGGLGLLLLVGGPVGLYLLWYTRGRDLPTAEVPEYISEPPDDLPAALVGTLIDEKAELKDIIAGITDLARRGALRLEEKQKEGRKGIGSGRDYIFHLQDAGKAIYPYEEKLLARLFGKGQERRMRDLQNKFYTAIPELQSQLYRQVVELGFFHSNPESTRQKWGCLGFLGAVVSIGLTFLLLVLLGDFSVLAACPGLALVVTMVCLIFVGRYMPRKTAQGAEAAAKWLAFKRYLETIEQHGDLEAVKNKFEEFLPYAVAFGLERRLISKFSAIETPVPSWWGPVLTPRPMYHPYGYGPARPAESSTQGGPPGPLAGSEAEVPSLAGMSGTIGSSLASMSDSLGSMLSSASSTLASQPAPKSSGGGGGWSGGGGGGGGGGGSRGFG